MVKDALSKPIRELEIEYTSFQAGVERWYFWLLDFLKGLGYEVKKIEDKFIASEASSFWGVIEQRKAIQQEKAMTYVAHIGTMTKSIFQILRELRIMDERKGYYDKSNEGEESAEIALKALWVDIVEGGAKNPNSVSGLAAQVGFVTLPDFFYSVHPKKPEEVDKFVKKVDTGEKVKEVLGRKLSQYLQWRENTEKEISTRKKFVLKSLRQHFNTIKLYMSWIKPYLRNVAKLQPGDTVMNEELITAAEGALIDLEIFGTKWNQEEIRSGKKKVKVNRRYHPCVQLKFHYRTVPEMMFQQEYQRAPVHVGKSIISFNAYVLTDDQIKKYQERQDKDTLDMIISMNASLEALKEDMNKYLKEAGEEEVALFGEEKEKGGIRTAGSGKEKTFLQKMTEPFISLIISFFRIKKAPEEKEKEESSWEEQMKKKQAEKMKKPASWKERVEKAKLVGDVEDNLWLVYDTFKKSYGMTTW